MYLLAIDQGNTRTKFGLFLHGTLERSWIADTDKSATPEMLYAQAFPSPELPRVLHLGLCSVVPELLPAWERMAAACQCPLTILTGQSPTPLRNAYATPDTLGGDRLMAAVAAAARVGTPVIPLHAGTATVVDAVSADGAYLGGMISLGIGSTANALTVATSALPLAAWQEPEHAIGRSSREAVANGLFYHSVGGVRAMVDAVRAELGTSAPLALTGGWAHALRPYLDHVALLDEFLALHGIAITLADVDDTDGHGRTQTDTDEHGQDYPQSV